MSNDPTAHGRQERTSSKVLVNGTVEACYAVGADIAAYTEWVDGLRSVEIVATDEQGRPASARFEAASFGRMSRYELAYDWSRSPEALSWHLVSGDLAREIEGRYRFVDVTEDEGQAITEVNYDLAIDLIVSVPGFVRRRVEDKIVNSALGRFKSRVESLGSQESQD